MSVESSDHIIPWMEGLAAVAIQLARRCTAPGSRLPLLSLYDAKAVVATGEDRLWLEVQDHIIPWMEGLGSCGYSARPEIVQAPAHAYFAVVYMTAKAVVATGEDRLWLYKKC
ncbi:hypothetical protein LWI29_006332 [Acer saccharum]|uniref:Uncharacterized protein n=1 Tax=Acer saccharum TaxID=4024 RepID=A0AA39STK5_ACESA|nr:hypothetical protein LWI29_006332 [Acer saccharum]